MSLRFLLIFFGLAHSSASLSKNLQSIINEELIPSDLVKMKAVDPNWRGEGIFERITTYAGLYAHRETNEIILETKEKLWTESEIIKELGYRRDEFKNLIETKNWNEFIFLRYFGTNQFTKYWDEALAELIDINKKYGEETVLMRAVIHDDINVVKILLERGADVNAKNSYGRPALHFAAYYGRIETMKLLLKFNAQINATTNSEETPLMWAVRHENVDAVKLLLERDALLDLKNNDEKTALDIATSYKNRNDIRNETIIELLETKQNQNRKSKRKRTDHADFESSQK